MYFYYSKLIEIDKNKTWKQTTVLQHAILRYMVTLLQKIYIKCKLFEDIHFSWYWCSLIYVTYIFNRYNNTRKTFSLLNEVAFCKCSFKDIQHKDDDFLKLSELLCTRIRRSRDRRLWCFNNIHAQNINALTLS